MPIITQFDYLKVIYKLESRGEAPTIGLLSKYFNVAQPSATQMIRALSKKKLVSWVPRGQISLLPKGAEEAVKMIRRHRVIESFLVKFVELDLWQAHVEAEELEHSASDMLVERLYEMCNSPSYDPHGDPIPNLMGVFPENIAVLPLMELQQGQSAIVATVSDQSPRAIQELSSKKIFRGTKISHIEKQTYLVNSTKLNLSPLAIKSVGVNSVS